MEHEMTTENKNSMVFTCAMSGEREALVVYPVGRKAMSFAYNDDCSVIIEGDDLIRLRDAISDQIALSQK